MVALAHCLEFVHSHVRPLHTRGNVFQVYADASYLGTADAFLDFASNVSCARKQAIARGAAIVHLALTDGAVVHETSIDEAAGSGRVLLIDHVSTHGRIVVLLHGMLARDGRTSIIVLTVLTIVSTTFLALRLLKRKKLGVDDWLLCFTLLVIYLDDVLGYLWATKGGEGAPMSSLSPDQVEWFLKMAFAPEIGYTFLVVTLKISILISYYRIFGTLRWFRWACYTVATFEAIWFVGVLFSILFQCIPVQKAWNPTLSGHCINFLAFLWANSISNAVLDFVVLLLPVLPVLNLQMSIEQKVLVLLSFSLGSIASIASTMRAVRTNTVDLNNFSGTVFQDAIWTYIEPHAGMLSACLPCLAKTFGQTILKGFNTILKSGSRLASLVSSRSSRSSSEGSKAEFDIINSKTQRAVYESYELGTEDRKEFSSFKDNMKGKSNESMRQLV